jgi:TolA-binding protein
LYYPKGRHTEEARSNFNAAISFIARYGDGLEKNDKSAEPDGQEIGIAAKIPQNEPSGNLEKSGVANRYNTALQLMEQENYIAAHQLFKEIIDENDAEFAPKSAFEIGRCFFFMNKFDECIRSGTQAVTKYPKHEKLPEILFFMGQSYEKTGRKEQASGFYTKLLSLINNKEDALYRKTADALLKIEENK